MCVCATLYDKRQNTTFCLIFFFAITSPSTCFIQKFIVWMLAKSFQTQTCTHTSASASPIIQNHSDFAETTQNWVFKQLSNFELIQLYRNLSEFGSACNEAVFRVKTTPRMIQLWSVVNIYTIKREYPKSGLLSSGKLQILSIASRSKCI